MNKDITFKFRASESELKMIKGKAAASGLSAAAFIISCCDAAYVPEYVPESDMQMPGQITLYDLLDQSDECPVGTTEAPTDGSAHG